MIAALLILFITVIPCTTPLHAQEQDSLRIMPLGDSITRGTGSSDDGGYRKPFYHNYTIEGVLFDLVGTLTLGEGFDPDHEGHGGKRSDWLADSVGVFLDSENPDVILLHIGTNDITGGRNLQDVIVDIESILDQAKSHNPLMTMMVAGIVPRRDEKDSITTELNTLIRSLVEVKKLHGYDIKYVDHNSAFKSHPNWETELLYDTKHPNDDGYAIMAQVWADSLGLSLPIDSVPPAAITDLTVDQIGSSTVKLIWTSPGDDSTIGIPSEYDLRYYTSVITEENYPDAYQATSEPVPLSSGSSQQFFVSGLQPGTEYYFAVKSRDEVPNESTISNTPSALTTGDATVFVDDFNREELGIHWITTDSVLIEGNEITSHYKEDSQLWTIRAIYSYVRNPDEVMFRYGQLNTEVENGSVGIMMMRNSLNVNNGQCYFIRYYNSAYHLYRMHNLDEPYELGTPVPEPYPPESGDLLRISYQKVGDENHFEVYLNEVLRGTLIDVDGILNPVTHYAGLAFENELPSRLGEVDDFTIMGATGNTPPSAFTLISPEDADTLGIGQIAFVWYQSIDPDPQSVVNYEIFIDTDSLFPQSPVASGISDTFYVINTNTFDRGIYYWQVIAYDDFGDSTPSSGAFTFLLRDGSGIGDDVPGGSILPRVASLLQNYPNPFNPLTVIRYDVPVSNLDTGSGEAHVPVRLRVFDVRGRLARTLVDTDAVPGSYRVTWDGRDDRGIGLPSGTYIYMITVGGESITRKMILIR